MIKNTTTKLIISVLVLSLAAVPVMAAKNSIDPAFNPSLLISDASFTDVGTFGTAEGIQKFLELKGSVLANTSTDFLAKLKEPDTDTKVALEDPEPKLTRLRTAAELVYDAATSHGLNPQVILVMLQKEQSLITGSFSSPQALQTALDHAVGFACPDSQPCGEIFKSFYRQLFGSFDADGNRWLGAAASLMRSYTTEINGVQVGRGPMVDSSGETFGS
ncbi:MAG TPA: hypothetical protein VL306_03035, partial [Methylomirabilota bacterium]|nr:hypothetical protein [Methylomirabilota bacterium]